MIITQIRKYSPEYTLSQLYINGGERFCWVLEDKKQPLGIKVLGETCIPEGTYRVKITRSNRWNKDMLLLYNQDDLSVERDGVRFTGIRPHGGNDVDDTAGCPLCAYTTDNSGTIWGRASDDILDFIQRREFRDDLVYWVISSY